MADEARHSKASEAELITDPVKLAEREALDYNPVTDRTYTHCYGRDVGEMGDFVDIRHFQRLFTDETSVKVAAPSVDTTQGT